MRLTTRFLTIRSVSGWITAIILLVLLLSVVSSYTYQKELVTYSKLVAGRLELFITYIKGVLGKYENLPELLARDQQLIDLLSNPLNESKTKVLNRYLEAINGINNASDTYIMDKDGLTVAASNWQTAHSFVGENFSYRPYFQQAMKGQPGRYFALGTTSGKRGYYFAYPVRDKQEIIGAVVIKANIDTVENQWGYNEGIFLVTDPANVIFLSTIPDWRFFVFGNIEPATREMIVKSRRYHNSDLRPLDVHVKKEYEFGELVRLVDGPDKSTSYLRQSKYMEKAGWTVQILSNVKPIKDKVIVVNVLVGSAFLLGYLILALVNQRRLRLVEVKRVENHARRVLQEANEKLESRVAERTKELTQTNEKLLNEIAERKETEKALKNTRSELVQTAKMATMGELSAGINHELNQPLSAIRSYSDNCRQLLTKGRLNDAIWNMEQISELTERMAQLGVQLKAFSRKTSGKLAAVPLHGVMGGALEILNPIIKKSEVRISISMNPGQLTVIANQVLLQQVLVNILSNAIQAIADSDKKEIELNAALHNENAIIKIIDSGPGIADEYLAKIFEPFFTTKKSGEGLGLGLTITGRIIKEMNGDIYIEPSKKGAHFVIVLKAATKEDEKV